MSANLGEEEFNGIDLLPDELLIHIFKLLPLEMLLECEGVSQRWRKLARDPAVWRKIPILYSGKPGHEEVGGKTLDIIKSHSVLVQCLRIHYIDSYPMIQSIIKMCDNLVSLELVMCRIGKDFEFDVAQNQNLKKLSLKNSLQWPNRDNDLLIKYDHFKDLTFLALSDFGLDPSNCDTLLTCKNLNHIFIDKIRTLDVDFITALISAKQMSLVSLHIYGGEAVNNKCLRLLSQCPRLVDLAIIRCENLTDEGLVALADLREIKHLQIWNNTNFSESNLLRTLRSPTLTGLRSLSLSRIGNISPVIVDVISEYYKNLRLLALYQCRRIINTDYEKQLKSKFRNIDVVLY